MAGYFEEMGWEELGEGQEPNHLIHMARFLLDFGMYDDNAQWPRLPPPASKEAIQSLTESTVESDKNETCPICMKNFSSGEKTIEMPCHHRFHANCILTWLSKTNSCPYCRFELPTDSERYEAFKKEKKRAVQRKEDLENLHNSMFS